MWIKREITADNLIWDEIYGEAEQTIRNLIDEGISSESIYEYLNEFFSNSEDNPVEITQLNDYVAYNADEIYEYFGVDPYNELTNSKNIIDGKVID